ncbi:ribosomal protein S18-alanine N-acetyltransferase [Tropicimonas sp.]|uniref:ribosomal protein S18-alanine N-acetyltransferase n=1 Tax=Tropicimonas sp. TaxID=2067044 RepID=UPI003A8C2682
MSPAARLAAIHAASFATPRPWSEDEIAAMLGDANTWLCDRETGFAMARAVAGEAELLTLAVHPAHRRRGLGRRLLSDFEDGARARRATTAFLEVSAENTPAAGLYRSAGYRQTGCRPGYYRTPDGMCIDALVFARVLG